MRRGATAVAANYLVRLAAGAAIVPANTPRVCPPATTQTHPRSESGDRKGQGRRPGWSGTRIIFRLDDLFDRVFAHLPGSGCGRGVA